METYLHSHLVFMVLILISNTKNLILFDYSCCYICSAISYTDTYIFFRICRLRFFMNRSKYKVFCRFSRLKGLLGNVDIYIYIYIYIYVHSFLTFAVDKDECLDLSCRRSISEKNFLYAFIRSFFCDLQLL